MVVVVRCTLDGDDANFAAPRRNFAERLRIARQLNRRDSGEAALLAGDLTMARHQAQAALSRNFCAANERR
ncbi:MAG TPA: hypothetical protein DCL15_06210 [Chloroflexi bacterium]|nr:hypothetical protein [Chloroflexota bacterium]